MINEDKMGYFYGGNTLKNGDAIVLYAAADFDILLLSVL